MCHVCKSSLKWGQEPKSKRDIFAGIKNNKKKLQGLKPKQGIFAGTKTIFNSLKIEYLISILVD